jgi:hypothetical protein
MLEKVVNAICNKKIIVDLFIKFYFKFFYIVNLISVNYNNLFEYIIE